MNVSEREYFERIFAERHAQYMQLFAASGEAVNKAEIALREYKALANEFRGTLTDQAQTFMPRVEAENRYNQHSERIRALELSARAGEGSNTAKEGSRAQAWQVIALFVTILLFALGVLFSYLTQR